MASARNLGAYCQYCEIDLGPTYAGWLNLPLDHVAPQGSRQAPAIDPSRLHDLVNCMPARRTCNEFLNQDRVDGDPA